MHVEPQRAVKLDQHLAGQGTRVAVVTNEPAHHGAVLLLDPSLVITAVRPGTGEFDPLLTGPLKQGFVDEGAVVVGVNAPDGKGQLPPDGFQACQDQGSLATASVQPVQMSVTTRLWMKEPDRGPPQWATRSISR